VTDGTTTTLLHTFNPVAGAGGLANFVTVNGRLFFNGTDPTYGTELWTSDGTVSGTKIVADLFPGPAGSNPSPVVAAGSEGYFTANDGTDGVLLYATDLTSPDAAHTTVVTPTDGNSFSNPSTFTAVGTHLYFVSNNGTELWTTDGQTTVQVLSGLNGVSQLTVVGNQLYFVNNGQELWVATGTSASRVSGSFTSPGQFTVDAGALYFTANDASGTGVWVANGTAATDLAAGLSSPGQLTPAGSLLYFTAGVGGVDLWETDGTSAQQLGQFDPGPSSSGPFFSGPTQAITNLTATSDGLYFNASDGISGLELWKTDGNPATPSAPVGSSQLVNVIENVAQAIELTAADPTPGATLTYTIVSAPQYGTLTGTGPKVIYTPSSTTPGTDRFSFTVSDGTTTSNVATVSITIVPSPPGLPAGQSANQATIATVADNSPATQQVSLTSPIGTILSNVAAVSNPSPANAPNLTFPIGFLDFNIHGLIPGDATTLTLTLPTGVTANDYYQYGPTADNPTSHWYEFLYDGTTGAQFVMPSGGQPEQIILHYVDGQRGDGDLLANGQIVDPGAPALTQIQPTITWANPAAIVYGTPLDHTQLSAMATAVVNGITVPVAGTFSYSPAADTVLAAGANQLLTVTFTPTDASAFTSATASVTIDVKPATPTIVIQPVSPTIYDGQAHSTTGEVFGVGGIDLGPATITYSSGTVPVDVGTYTATASFAGNADYTVATASTTLQITPAPLSVSTSSSVMLIGTSPSALSGAVGQSSFSGTTAYTTTQGDTITVTLSTTATSSSPVGQYPISASLSGSKAFDYVIRPAYGTMYVVSVGADPTSTTGAQAVSFWDDKGNKALITAGDLSSLDVLNLLSGNGKAFDPNAVAQLQSWLQKSTNSGQDNSSVGYQLSAQLAAMDLNVLSGYVRTSDLVYVGGLLPYASGFGLAGLTADGFISIGNLMNAANAVLALTSPNSGYATALANALQAANNNASFVQAQFLVLDTLYAQGKLF
jgi:ELWxxDGT repeat protein